MEKYGKSAAVQITAVFVAPEQVDCRRVFETGDFTNWSNHIFRSQ